jgi:ribosomal protein S18 acetylase RimI-like enzyme
MKIRNANLGDLKEILRIKKSEKALNDFYADNASYYGYLIREGIVIVATDGSRMVGLMGGEKEIEFYHSYIEDLWVAKGYRKKDLAWRLYFEYEKQCRKEGIRYMSAHVSEANKVAIAVIESAGFKRGKKYYLIQKKIG